MADNGIGFSLEISDEVFYKLKQADQAIQTIGDTSKKTQQTVKDAFTQMSLSVKPFVDQLNLANDKLGAKGFVDMAKGIGSVGTATQQSTSDVLDMVNAVNKLVEALSKTKGGSTKPKELDETSQKLREQAEVYNKLVSSMTNYQTMASKPMLSTEDASTANLKEIATIRQKIKASEDEINAEIASQNISKQNVTLVTKETDVQRTNNIALTEKIEKHKQLTSEYDKLSKVQTRLERSLKKEGDEREKTARNTDKLRIAQERGTIASEKAQAQTYDGAIASSNEAKSIAQRITAINNLKKARENLLVTDTKYAQKLEQLNSAIRKNEKANKDAVTQGEKLRKTHSGLINTSDQLMRRLALMFSVSQISGYITRLATVRGEFELQNKSLAAILQNKDEADKLFGQITDLAVRSPFKLKELVTYTKQLAAYRIETSKLYDTTKMLADVSAGVGVGMERLILAFGQVKAANFLRGCLGYGTNVELYNGDTKEVQDIVIGDVLVGDDGLERNISELIRGKEQMYNIASYDSFTPTYRVNENHILTLFDKESNSLVDIYVLEYLKNPSRYLGYTVEGTYEIIVTKDIVDDYYGFVIDGNKRFIIEGGIVTHNTELRQFSEAGINVLGELASMYSEVEEQAVSTADVMERVSKRMVTFGDVEDVFKRLTSAGGIFYNMQEIQAETLTGQISNLNDSIDIMLNKIGTEQEGALKGGIGIAKTLVDNYKAIEIGLKAIIAGFGVYTFQVIRAGMANKAFASSQIEATITNGGLQKAIAKTSLAFKSLTTFMMKNPIVLVATAITATGLAIYNQSNKLDEARKKYDVLTNSIERSRRGLDNIIKSIQSQDEVIKSTSKATSTLVKGTEEYAKAIEDESKASKTRNSLLEELKTKFPEVYAGLVIQKDGTVDLTDAQEKYNEQLKQTNILNYLISQSGSLFSDDVATNIQDATDSFAEMRIAMGYLDSAYDVTESHLRALLANNEGFSKAYGKSILAILNSEGDASQKLLKINKIIQAQRDAMVGTPYALSGDERKGLQELIKLQEKYTSALKDSKDATKDYIDDVDTLYSQLTPIIQDFKVTADLATEAGRKTARNTIKAVVESLGVADKAIQDLLRQKFEIELGIKLNFDSADIEKSLDAWALDYNKYAKTLDLTGISSLEVDQLDETRLTVAKKVSAEYKAQSDILAKMSAKGQHLYTEDEVKKRRELVAELKKLRTYVGGDVSTAKKGESVASKRLKDQIALLKTVNSEYEKQLKYWDKEESHSRTMEGFEKALQNLGIETEGLKFDDKGIYNYLDKIKERAAKVGGDANKAFLKALGELKVQFEIEAKIKKLDTLEAEIATLFEGYEVGVELESKGLPVDDVASILGLNVYTLEEVKTKFLAKYKGVLYDIQKVTKDGINAGDIIAGTSGQEGLDEYAKVMDKITDIQAKEAKVRITEYSAYLKKTMSERVKIEIETQKKIAEIPVEFTAPQRETATQEIEKEGKKKLDMESWDEFQNTELYIQLFSDLEFVSSKTLDNLKAKLLGMRDSLKGLDPTQLKEIESKLTEIDERMIDRNPFEGLIKNIASYGADLKKLKQLESEALLSEEDTTVQSDVVDASAKELGSAQAKLKVLKETEEVSKSDINLAQAKVSEAQVDLDLQASILATKKKISEEDAKQLLDQQAKLVETNKQINSVGSTGTQAVNSVNQIISTIEYFGIEVSDQIKDAISGVGEMFSALESLDLTNPMSVITSSIGLVTGLAKTIGSLFGWNDLDKEREAFIQREIASLDKLGKAYEKLEKTFENAFSMGTLKSANDAMQANIEAQIEAYDAMIVAEEEKKKTDDDKIKEWVSERERLLEEQREQEEAFIEQQGGIGSEANYKSASQGFIDAWHGAFMETGDGLSGLEENFDEMFHNLLKKQAMLKFAEKFLDPIMKELDKSLTDESSGGIALTTDEANKIKEMAEKSLPELNEVLKSFFESMGEFGGEATQGLSALQKGITTITEPQASALESLLNSMRFEIFNQSKVFEAIKLIVTGTNRYMPTIHAELKLQTQLLTNIDNKLGSVIKSGHPTLGGSYFKVNS